MILIEELHRHGTEVVVSVDVGPPRSDSTAIVAMTTATGQQVPARVVYDWWGEMLASARRAGRREHRAELRSRRLVALQRRRRHGRPRGR